MFLLHNHVKCLVLSFIWEFVANNTDDWDCCDDDVVNGRVCPRFSHPHFFISPTPKSFGLTSANDCACCCVDDTFKLLFGGYILSNCFNDSFKKACNQNVKSSVVLNHHDRYDFSVTISNRISLFTWTAVSAATKAGLPKPWDMSEKWVNGFCIHGSNSRGGLVLHNGDLSLFSNWTSSSIMILQWKNNHKNVKRTK